MSHRILLLLGAVLVAGGLFTSCIRVPDISLKTPFSAPADPPAPASPANPGTSAGPAVSPPSNDPPPDLEGAKRALEGARGVYTNLVGLLSAAKADMKAKAALVKEKERQAVADRIVRDGWWVFAIGLLGSIVGVICVAKNYGMGGWWVLLGGASVSALGLAMVWLGPHWLNITRGAVGVAGLSMIVGAYWAWKHRKLLKAKASKSISQLT